MVSLIEIFAAFLSAARPGPSAFTTDRTDDGVIAIVVALAGLSYGANQGGKGNGVALRAREIGTRGVLALASRNIGALRGFSADGGLEQLRSIRPNLVCRRRRTGEIFQRARGCYGPTRFTDR